MRKVTASAVILTAITGCSQSDVPSSKWSFDEPSSQRFDTAFTGQGSGSKALAEAFGSSSQPLWGQSLDELMGPAFEQPDDTNGPTLSSRQSGTLADAAALAGAADSSASSGSARVDPLAPVRSYLSATGSISGIRTRVPYSSQVYLPPASIYGTSSSASAEVATVPLLDIPTASDIPAVDTSPTVADWAAGAAETFANGDFALGATDQSQSVASASSVFNPVASSGAFAAESVVPASSESVFASTVSPAAERFVSESYVEVQPSDGRFDSALLSNRVSGESDARTNQLAILQDTLPVLEPASPDSGLLASAFDTVAEPTAAEPTTLAAEPVAEATVSMGTSILQTLARNGDAEALAALAASDAELMTVDNSIAEDIVETSSGSIEISIEETPESTLSEVAVPTQPPTLDSLLASMPRRDQSQLVTDFGIAPRGSQRVSIASDEISDSEAQPDIVVEPSDRAIPTFRPLPLELPLPAGLLPAVPTDVPVESTPAELGLVEPEGSASLHSDAAPDASALLTDGAAYGLRPDGYRSPLLEGLDLGDAPAALSTIYVPVPEATPIDVSALLIREAIAAVSHEAIGISTTTGFITSPNGVSDSVTLSRLNGLSVLEGATIQSLEGYGVDHSVMQRVRLGDVSHATSVAASHSTHQKSAADQKLLPLVSGRRQHRQHIVGQ